MLGLRPGAPPARSCASCSAAGPQAPACAQTLAALAETERSRPRFEVDAGRRARRAWYSLSVRRDRAGGRRAIEAIAVLSDITRLKAQQAELESAGARPRADVQPVRGRHRLRAPRPIQRANEAFATLTGYPVDGAGRRSTVAVPRPRRVRGAAAQRRRAAAPAGRWSGERQLRRRDGQLLWVQVSKRLVVEGDPSGGMIASYVNVDARHRAEQAVALQAERTRAILDSVLVGIVTVGARGIEWMNRSARRMFGGDLADFVGQPIGTVATPEPDHPFARRSTSDELFEGQAETFECRVKARDGREFWVVGNVVATGREPPAAS